MESANNFVKNIKLFSYCLIFVVLYLLNMLSIRPVLNKILLNSRHDG